MLCRALETAVNKARPGGLHAHMVAQPGGGAPVLYPSSVLAQYWADERDASGAAAPPAQQHSVPEGGGDGEAPDSGVCKGLVVLLPLTLGIGKVRCWYNSAEDDCPVTARLHKRPSLSGIRSQSWPLRCSVSKPI